MRITAAVPLAPIVAWPSRALWDTESFPSLSLSVCVCSPATAGSSCLLCCWQSYAATVLAAAYLNLKGSPHFYQMSILSRR